MRTIKVDKSWQLLHINRHGNNYTSHTKTKTKTLHIQRHGNLSTLHAQNTAKNIFSNKIFQLENLSIIIAFTFSWKWKWYSESRWHGAYIALCAKALKVFPSPRLPVTCKGSALLCYCLASMAACVGNLRDCGLRSANRSHNRCSMHSVHTRDLRPDQQVRTDAWDTKLRPIS